MLVEIARVTGGVGFPGGSAGKNLPVSQEMQFRSLSREDLEKEMATHSSILAWEIPRTEEPGRLQYVGLPRVGHHFATKQQLVMKCLLLKSKYPKVLKTLERDL